MPDKIHILLVDDDPLIRRLYGGKLTEAGFEVLYAGDGNEGREMARRLHPDLILMDIRMPGMEDGIAVAQRLKSEQQTMDIPLIFLTNNDLSMEAEKWVKETGGTDYIHKSIGLEEFVERVKSALQAKK